jgi:hypothetical protein
MMKPMAGARGTLSGRAGEEEADMIRPEDNRPTDQPFEGGKTISAQGLS